jgi:ABC-type polar amino acid transport system ATPase subunit/GNAT superfamily N-acetyltransferase
MPSAHALSWDLKLSSPTPTGFRAAQVQSMFDVPPRERQEVKLKGELELPEEWQIGAIVGASGAGKSSIARELWGDQLVQGFEWGATCILDDFPDQMSVKDVVESLNSVGLCSTPVWLRPYKVLSTGQRFRADLARALAQSDGLVVYDEFTSVVDRNVARAAAVAVTKHMRRHPDTRFVAVTCHRDVLPWLEPDWYYDIDLHQLSKERLRRPGIAIELHRIHPLAWWPLFRGHHYLTAEISPNCRAWLCLANFGEERVIVGFMSIITAAGMKGWRRGHRAVVLPDYQGMGIGNAMIELCGEILWRAKLRYRSRTGSPALHHYRRKHPDRWRLVGAPTMEEGRQMGLSRGGMTSIGRMTATWTYTPIALRDAELRPAS